MEPSRPLLLDPHSPSRSPSERIVSVSPRHGGAPRTLRSWGTFFLSLAGLAALSGCQCEAEQSGSTSGAEAQTAAPAQSAQESVKADAAKQVIPQGPLGNPTPVGPPLEILPGKGIGPIRFGATFETVERLMTNPCDVRTETKCIYRNQAVEFTMTEGVVSHILLHRRDRPAGTASDGAPLYFGSFYGGLQPTIALGLHKYVAVTELKPAQRVETLTEPGEYGTLERHYYEGIVMEYDRLENGNVVLGGIQIVPAPDAESPALSLQEIQEKKAAAKKQRPQPSP